MTVLESNHSQQLISAAHEGDQGRDGMTHGIPDPRNQLLKSVSEMMWMDHWIRGKPKFQWKDVLKTLEEAEVRAGIASPATSSAR